MFRSSHQPQLCDIARDSPPDDLQACAVVRRYQHNQQIGERYNADNNWYQVVSGAVRQYSVQPDGRRQIVDLLLPGDFWCFATPDGERFGSEAIIEGTVVTCYPWQRLKYLADANPGVADRIRLAGFETIFRLQRQLLVLGRVKASEKVASFLLELKERLSSELDEEIILPISRYDIADYLAISVETVSRSITGLQHRGAIRLDSARHLKIVDRNKLDLPARN
jgi:CRP-like cAMP-binding protein